MTTETETPATAAPIRTEAAQKARQDAAHSLWAWGWYDLADHVAKSDQP